MKQLSDTQLWLFPQCYLGLNSVCPELHGHRLHVLAMLNSFMATNPSLPTRPIHETSISITTLSDKRNWEIPAIYLNSNYVISIWSISFYLLSLIFVYVYIYIVYLFIKHASNLFNSSKAIYHRPNPCKDRWKEV